MLDEIKPESPIIESLTYKPNLFVNPQPEEEVTKSPQAFKNNLLF